MFLLFPQEINIFKSKLPNEMWLYIWEFHFNDWLEEVGGILQKKRLQVQLYRNKTYYNFEAYQDFLQKFKHFLHQKGLYQKVFDKNLKHLCICHMNRLGLMNVHIEENCFYFEIQSFLKLLAQD